MDKHDVVADIKRVAALLGHPPTKREYLEHGSCGHAYERLFGLWSEVLKASFGEIIPESSHKKRIESFFGKDVNSIISNQLKAANLSVFGTSKSILCIPDLHAPWIHKDSLSAMYVLAEILKPDIIVALGDDFDMFSFGKFPRSHMLIKADDEIREARKQLEEMWNTLRKLCPKAELISLVGNHNMRPFKRILETNCPELELFLDLKSLFEFDGVKTVHDPREVVMIEGIHFTHGHLKHGSHRAITNTHCVHGHTHNGGLIINKVAGKLLFELDCGYLGAPDALCFGYTAKRITNWTRGVGYISPLGPIFIPFE